MTNSPYEQIRDLARQQASVSTAGDVDEAVRLLSDRAALLLDAPEPTAGDAEAIRETLQLDFMLAGVLREHMLAVRNEALGLQRARTAVSGYRPSLAHDPRLFDTQR